MLRIEARGQPSRRMLWLTPLLAIALTVVSGFCLFAVLGHDPLAALYHFFVSPVTSTYGVAELVVKATPLILIATGLAMIVAALQVYIRDLKNLMPYLLRVWLFASPVLYFADQMPEKYQFLLNVNPLGQLLTAWSDVLDRGIAPDPVDLALGAAWALAFLIGGALFFISREREFAVRL
jgi:ABC-type polysaccharide/polyol phosphate export permease